MRAPHDSNLVNVLACVSVCRLSVLVLSAVQCDAAAVAAVAASVVGDGCYFKHTMPDYMRRQLCAHALSFY